MRPPLAPLVLGLAGLLPAAFAAALGWFAAPDLQATGVQLGITYAALILSYLGGMWWGIAVTRAGPDGLWGLLGLAVVPSLFALGCLLLAGAQPALAATLLAMAILATLPVDALLQGAGLAPAWWMRLRVPLSAGLALATAALAALLWRAG